MPRYGRRPPLGACDRLVSWRPGTERGRRQQPRQRPRLEPAVRGADDVDAMPPRRDARRGGVGGSAAREFERRTLRFNDTRRSIWVAFTKDDYAVAKSSLVRRVEAEQREREEDGGAAPASDPVGYVPYDQRLYDELMALFQWGAGSGVAGRGRAPAAVRPRVVVHAPLELLVGCSDDAVAEIAGVGPVPAEVVRRLACDANVDLAVEDPEGTILNQGRARRDPHSGAAGGNRPPGQGLSVLRLQLYRVHQRPPHRALGRWWSDEPRQPGHAVRPAPSCCARTRLDRVGRCQRGVDLHWPARALDAVSSLADMATFIGSRIRATGSATGSEHADASLSRVRP